MDAAKAVGLFFWLGLVNVEGGPIQGTVEGVTFEPTDYQPDGAYILWLDGNRKLVLSKTRVAQMIEITGEGDDENWLGHHIELYKDVVRGKNTISLRKPA